MSLRHSNSLEGKKYLELICFDVRKMQKDNFVQGYFLSENRNLWHVNFQTISKQTLDPEGQVLTLKVWNFNRQ